MSHQVILRTGDVGMPQNHEELISFPYECDNFQKHSFRATEDDHDVLVCVPTSGGKTTVAIWAILHHIKRLKKRVVYTTPIKSLSNEKFNEFISKFAQYGIRVGILTGDNKINPDADIILATAEILRNSLYQIDKKIEDSKYNLPDNFIDSIGCVIMDEVHYMNDKDRGRVWEETIVMLPNNIQLIMLSGTVGNRDYFSRWISNCRQRNVSIVYEPTRIIPLEHSFFVNKKIYPFLDNNDSFNTTNFNLAKDTYKTLKEERQKRIHKDYNEKEDLKNLVTYLNNNDMLQAIIFSFSRHKCEVYANIVGECNFNFLDKDEKKQIDYWFQEFILKQKDESGECKYRNIAQIYEVKKMLDCGIAYHHAGMLQNLREMIEILMKKKLIKLLFATETLCIGVNVPAKTCVFTGLKKNTGETERNINTSEYRQMAGRAGRRGIDIKGNVIILPLRDFPYDTELRSIVTGANLEIKSNFRFDYQTILRLANNPNINPIQTFEKSLMNAEILDQIRILNNEKRKKETELLSVDNKKIREYLDGWEEDQVKTQVLNGTGIDGKVIVKQLKEEVEYFFQLENQQKENTLIKLSKTQIQEYNKLKTKIMGNEFMKQYFQILTQNEKLQNDLINLTNKTDHLCQTIKIMYHNYYSVLHDLKYVKSKSEFIKKEELDAKGVICSQINECNALILTEMIFKDYFNYVDSTETVALLTTMCDPIRKDKVYGLHDFEGTDSLHETLDYLDEDVKNIQEIERKYLPLENRTEMLICTDFMDASYQWAKGKTVHQMLEYFDGEDGIPIELFCKNMMKISNILHTIIGIYKMLNKNIEIIPKLETAKDSILRDIIHVNSLYLTN